MPTIGFWLRLQDRVDLRGDDSWQFVAGLVPPLSEAMHFLLENGEPRLHLGHGLDGKCVNR